MDGLLSGALTAAGLIKPGSARVGRNAENAKITGGNVSAKFHSRKVLPKDLLLAAFGFVMAGLLLCLVGMSSASAQPPIHALNDPHKIVRITIPQNKSTTVLFDRDYKDVLVGNEKIADIVPLTNRSLYLLAKSIGMTRMVIVDDKKELLGVIEVEVSYDVTELTRRLREVIPNSQIKATAVNGKILLSGMSHDAPSITRAIEIALQFAPKDAISNAVTVNTSQQVLLEVRFVEVSRRADRDLGVSWFGRSSNDNFLGTTGGATLGSSQGDGGLIDRVLFPFATSTFPSGNLPFGTFLQRSLNIGIDADVIVRALEERGLARRLAEPNLVALSGDTANFLAGGEFPFPVPQNNDTITIQFKKFGVGLAFTPTVLARGMINLKIEPEVSELDPANSVTVRDSTIPGLIVRRASTTLELRDGQSFAMAGLLQFSNRKAQRQLPWVGEVPVLGALFRSASYQKNETDLVIIVTPRLVKPAVPGEHLATPLEKSIPTNDTEFFLLGKQERWKTRVSRRDLEAGHQLDLEDGENFGDRGGIGSLKK